MRLIAFILFCGIALTSISACVPVSGNTGTLSPTSVSSTKCPTLEGYPDCQR